jgi:transcriptional regulator with XRE-family HTH domain
VQKGDIDMKLSEYLIEYRREQGLSQRQLAEKCGLTNGYINMIEKGVNPKTNQPIVPSIASYKKIANGTGKSLQDLLSMIEDSPVRLEANIGTPIKMDDSILRFALFGDPARDITEEELQMIKEYAKFVRERKHTP